MARYIRDLSCQSGLPRPIGAGCFHLSNAPDQKRARSFALKSTQAPVLWIWLLADTYGNTYQTGLSLDVVW